MLIKDQTEILAKIGLFKGLSKADLRRIAILVRVQFYKQGKQVLAEGSTGHSIYLVKSGELTVSHFVRGIRRELARFGPGEHFGEISFIDGKPRSATIHAIHDSELYVLSRRAFDLLLNKNPKLKIKLQKALLLELCDKLRSRVNSLDFELTDLLPVSIFEINQKGNITFANRNGLRNFGYSEKDFDKGLHFSRLLQSDKKGLLKKLFSSRVKECKCIRKDRSTFPAIVQVDPIFQRGKRAGYRTTLIDITERKRIEEELRNARDELEKRVKERTAELQKSEERYALSIRGANDGLWDWDLLTNELHYSPRSKSILGIPPQEKAVDSSCWMKRVHPEDTQQVKGAIDHHIRGLTPNLQIEFRVITKDGSCKWVLCRGLAVRNSKGDAYRMAGSHSDITERKHLEQQLIQNAFYDSLTSLPNRALFMDRLQLALERSRKRHHPLFAVVCLDLDRFKNINDSMGHMAGDKLLVYVSQRLNASVRPGDTVARMGGDEFVILLEDLKDPGDAIRVVLRILNAFSLPFQLQKKSIFITASLGIALSGREKPYERSENVLRDADIAMYRAKDKGKATYEIFDDAMHARARHAMQVEMDMRSGLARNEYKLKYQPIVCLATGRISGFEALCRWQHPSRGIVMPDEFIPAAEETGLIIPIGQEVLRLACKQISAWNKQFDSHPPLFMSVNVSGRQLFESDFVDHVDEVLRETRLNPEFLKLEITESVMIENMEPAILLLNRLKEKGIHLNLDDFGTGYSSLSTLHRFPIDTLKVDCSFVQGMVRHPEKMQIVSTVIALARNLEMSVVAEGVEGSRELAQLRNLQCDYAQGFHFAEALSSEDATEMIRKRPQW